jgi:hypothetical protein
MLAARVTDTSCGCVPGSSSRLRGRGEQGDSNPKGNCHGQAEDIANCQREGNANCQREGNANCDGQAEGITNALKPGGPGAVCGSPVGPRGTVRQRR